VVARVALPVESSETAPRVVAPLRKVTVPVGTCVVPVGGDTTAERVTLPPVATLALLVESRVVVANGVSVVTTTVDVSAAVFAGSTLPAPSVAIE
jgi:hypothetical protein